ncbi:MAG: hypothetical protein K0Q59_5657 [Paenibacillus sp.]|nr:hypothetical protein [Paenibacillus sp.]
MPDQQFVPSKKITMKDIASHLQIDRTTVSKALADNPGLSAEMIEKVKKAAEELGYRKDPFASGLTTGKNAVLGIVISDEINRGIYASFVKSFQHVAKKNNFAVIICHVNHNDKEVLEAIDLLKQQRVSGATFVARSYHPLDEKYLIQLVESGIAINVTGTGAIHESIDRVKFDHHKAGYELTNYLIRLGHTRIGFLADLYIVDKVKQARLANQLPSSTHERAAGYMQAMLEAGLPPLFEPVRSSSAATSTIVQKSYHTVKAMNGRLGDVSALIGQNDDFALGALFALKELGIAIPEQMSLAGFDDSSAILGVPELTTMRMPLQQSGEAAGQMLTERIQSLKKPTACVTLEYELIVRASTGPAIKNGTA